MQTVTRKLILDYSVSDVYNFFRDLRNYLSGIENIKIDSSGKKANVNVTGFGNIDFCISNIVENKRVSIYSKTINTAIKAELIELGDSKTEILLIGLSDPNCGFIKNYIISAVVPRAMDKIVENIKEIKL